jgi:hypothetical protein
MRPLECYQKADAGVRSHRCTRDRSDPPLLLEFMQGCHVLGLSVCAPMPPNSYPQVDVKLTLCALGIAFEPQCRLAVPTLLAAQALGPTRCSFCPRRTPRKALAATRAACSGPPPSSSWTPCWAWGRLPMVRRFTGIVHGVLGCRVWVFWGGLTLWA